MPKQSTTKNENKTKSPDLELAFQGINKKFGDGALMRLGDAKKMNVYCILYLLEMFFSGQQKSQF
mgnify:CR=1 FL=1